MANSNTITLANGQSSYPAIPAGQTTYLGTVATTTMPGQTAMQFKPTPVSGGTNNFLGVWNAYNRVMVRSEERDSTNGWTYNTATWRPADGANNNLSNRITWIDGLGQVEVNAEFINLACSCSGATVTGIIEINFDSISAVPYFATGMELAGSVTVQFGGGSTTPAVFVEMEM